MNHLDWDAIDQVMLDMDGTLLDLHFDNHFWLDHVPKRYAEARSLPFEVARTELLERYQARSGTLEWYCVDYWSETLQLDIEALKEEVSHLIAIHPHVIDFLEARRQQGKRLLLVTNAHRKALKLKMHKTRLHDHFDRLHSAHDLGHAKESPAFWDKLQSIEPFDPGRTLFIDDSLPVLRAARNHGIGWLVAIEAPDSRQIPKPQEEFLGVRGFEDLV
jgi:putative hydrolase of the HAD superfamily